MSCSRWLILLAAVLLSACASRPERVPLKVEQEQLQIALLPINHQRKPVVLAQEYGRFPDPDEILAKLRP